MQNSECVKELLKLGCKEEECDPSVIKDFDFSKIVNIKSDLLDCFVRERAQEDLTEKLKYPTKENEKD